MERDVEHDDCIPAELLLHASLFAYQRAHGKIAGTARSAILQLAIPYLIDMVAISGLPDIRNETGIKNTIGTYISMVKKGGYIKDAELRQVSDTTCVFEVRGCSFAVRGHKIFRDGGLICPFAMLAAAVISHNTNVPLSIEDSVFSENGSSTSITIRKDIKPT